MTVMPLGYPKNVFQLFHFPFKNIFLSSRSAAFMWSSPVSSNNGYAVAWVEETFPCSSPINNNRQNKKKIHIRGWMGGLCVKQNR